MFSGRHDLNKADEKIFLDRNPEIFGALVDYLRNDRRLYPEFDNENKKKLFAEERNHWGIKTPSEEESHIESQFAVEIVEMLKKEPGSEEDFEDKNNMLGAIKKTWNDIGPLKLIEIVRNAQDDISYNCEYNSIKNDLEVYTYGQINEQAGICRQINPAT